MTERFGEWVLANANYQTQYDVEENIKSIKKTIRELEEELVPREPKAQ